MHTAYAANRKLIPALPDGPYPNLRGPSTGWPSGRLRNSATRAAVLPAAGTSPPGFPVTLVGARPLSAAPRVPGTGAGVPAFW
nr:hypothetical protein KitaXyl93_68380 [Kitasatospora sp. Xyl93]